MAVQVVHSGGGPVSVNVTTTPAISVTSPQVSVVDVNPVYTSGQPGDTGPQGPQGPAGANGADGVTVTYTLSAQDGANSDEEKVRITGSNGTSSEVVLEAGTNLSIARSGDKITFASTVTDAVLESDTSTSGFGFVVDDDAMNNASDTKVPTQQSVKAYVDNNVTTANVTTNLSTSYQTDRVTIVSSDGTDAVILEATGSQAGVMTVAMHDKLDGIASNADATTSSNVNAAGAIMHSDVAGSATGLITRAASEQYTVVAASTSNISEGSNLYYTDARADARVSAVIDTDNTLGSPSDTLVPSQAAIKTYVDNQLGTQNLSLGTVTGTTVAVNISGGGSSVTIPASTTSEAGLMTEAQFDKLAGIEANATADQTAAEIRTLVEAATDSNVFTDADHSKLNGIEANATADQTNAEIRAAVEAATDSNVFTDADHSKLNAIESNADVTDSNNVVAALVSATSISGGNQTSIKSNLGIIDPAATNNLSDVSAAGGANGQLLIYDAGNNVYDPANLTAGSNISITNGAGSITIASTASGGASALNDLSDVTVGGASSGQYLVHNGGAFVNQALDISQDNDPDLGGNLDVGDHSIITSTGNKDITLNPHGTGKVNIGSYPIRTDDSDPGNSENGQVLMYVASEDQIKLVLPPQGTVTTTGSPSNNQIATFTSNSNELDGSASLTFDGTNFTTPNVLVEEGTLSAPGRFGSGARVTKTMFTDANANKTAGDVYVFRAGDSVWGAQASASAEGTATGVLAVAGSTSSAAGMVLSGIVRVADNSSLGSAAGAILYLDTTAGHVTATKPTGTGKIVRIVGYVVDPGGAGGATNDGVIYFDPSKDWIELS